MCLPRLSPSPRVHYSSQRLEEEKSRDTQFPLECTQSSFEHEHTKADGPMKKKAYFSNPFLHGSVPRIAEG